MWVIIAYRPTSIGLTFSLPVYGKAVNRPITNDSRCLNRGLLCRSLTERTEEVLTSVIFEADLLLVLFSF